MQLQVLSFALALPCILSAVVEPILRQSQESDDLGQYQYSYESGLESKSESRSPDGRTQGSYSYLDSNGEVQHVKYTAGVEGFRIITATNLPVEGAGAGVRENDFPVRGGPGTHRRLHNQVGILGDTPEVIAARMQHEAAHAAALAVLPRIPQSHAPVHRNVHSRPAFGNFGQSGILGDTPEVLAAKMQHAAAHAEILRTLPSRPEQNHFTPNPAIHFAHRHANHNDNRGIPIFAEDIPRSALGETPEVAAAREAHLAVYAQVKSNLPASNSNF